MVKMDGEIGAPGRDRTCDLRFRKPLLYPLSYGGGDGARGAEFTTTPQVISIEVTSVSKPQLRTTPRRSHIKSDRAGG
ncbi:MAG: hypothetical protein RLZ84_1430 [Actinomycetota bacterium]